MRTLFISDLHLDSSRPKITETFLRFLEEHALQADKLYILGDLFEVWVGDDDLTALHRSVISALRKLSNSGVPIYIMHGNRDFLIGKRFLKATGCKLLFDPSLIDLYGHKVLLMHGDLLCTQDIEYQKFREKWQKRWLRTLFLMLPLKLRKYLARKLREKSQHHTATTAASIMDVTEGEAERRLSEYDSKLLIHGHTHRPAIHQLQNGLTRIVLDAWHEHGNVLACQVDEQGELQYKLRNF